MQKDNWQFPNWTPRQIINTSFIIAWALFVAGIISVCFLNWIGLIGFSVASHLICAVLGLVAFFLVSGGILGYHERKRLSAPSMELQLRELESQFERAAIQSRMLEQEISADYVAAYLTHCRENDIHYDITEVAAMASHVYIASCPCSACNERAKQVALSKEQITSTGTTAVSFVVGLSGDLSGSSPFTAGTRIRMIDRSFVQFNGTHWIPVEEAPVDVKLDKSYQLNDEHRFNAHLDKTQRLLQELETAVKEWEDYESPEEVFGRVHQ